MANEIVMSALGRPFQIGTLYNYQQDIIVPGKKSSTLGTIFDFICMSIHSFN
jgi:hypothetical protein